jgi:surface protein
MTISSDNLTYDDPDFITSDISISLDFTPSRDINLDTFDISDISSNGGYITEFSDTSAIFTPTVSGDISINIYAGTFTDTIGNLNEEYVLEFRFEPTFDTNIYLEAAVNEYVTEDYGSKKYGNINSWTLLSSITSFETLFKDKTSFNENINNWDVSNITNMKRMFYNATSFNQPLNNWNVSSVTNMVEMFRNTPFNQNLASWDVSAVTNFEYMFENTALSKINKTEIHYSWYAQNPTHWQIPGEWDVYSEFTNKTNLDSVIYDYLNGDSTTVENLENEYGIIENWKFNSSLTTFNNLFNETNFNQNINNWNVSNITNMEGIFSGSNFNQPLNNWNVGNVIDMDVMFSRTDYFNQPLNEWDVTSATTMYGMFAETDQFNQPLNNWIVSNVRNMGGMFELAEKFNQDISNWNISAVTKMQHMFSRSDFNQSLNDWNVGNVEDFFGMFNSNPSFNHPLDNWDVTSATRMYRMFYNCTSFNQNLESWNIANIIWEGDPGATFGDMFAGTNLSQANRDAIKQSWNSQGNYWWNNYGINNSGI